MYEYCQLSLTYNACLKLVKVKSYNIVKKSKHRFMVIKFVNLHNPLLTIISLEVHIFIDLKLYLHCRIDYIIKLLGHICTIPRTFSSLDFFTDVIFYL